MKELYRAVPAGAGAKISAAFAAVVLIFFSSCVGVSADITINPGNSGTMVLEYRLSRALESVGRQDGNEHRLPLPVGKADLERTVARLPGMKLVSVSTKTDERDLVVNAKLEFADMETLLAFLDPSGKKAVYEKAASGAAPNSLVLDFGGAGNGAPVNGEPLVEFFNKVSEGYFVNISLNLPAEGKLEPPSLPGAAVNASGKKLSFSTPLGAVLSSGENVVLKFNW